MADETNINKIAGDLIGRDQPIGGDKVCGDQIKVGDITGSTGIAVGKNIQQQVNVTNNNPTAQVFNDVREVSAD